MCWRDKYQRYGFFHLLWYSNTKEDVFQSKPCLLAHPTLCRQRDPPQLPRGPRFSVNKVFPLEAQIITGWILLWCSETGDLNQPRAWREEQSSVLCVRFLNTNMTQSRQCSAAPHVTNPAAGPHTHKHTYTHASRLLCLCSACISQTAVIVWHVWMKFDQSQWLTMTV